MWLGPIKSDFAYISCLKQEGAQLMNLILTRRGEFRMKSGRNLHPWRVANK